MQWASPEPGSHDQERTTQGLSYCACTHLQPHIIGYLVPLNQFPHEVEIRIACSGIRNLDLLEPALEKRLEEDHLLRDSHGSREGLVPVSQVRRQPDGGCFIHPRGPLTI